MFAALCQKSGMGTCSSKSQKVKPRDEDEAFDQAVHELKITRDRIVKYQKRMEKDNETQIQIARQLVKEKQLEKAKVIIRQKKQREVYIQRADGMLSNIQNQIDQMESKKVELAVFENLKETNAILKQMAEKMPIEEIEALMDSNAELEEHINEVSAILAQDMTPADQKLADEEYEALLDQMIEGEGSKQTPAKSTPEHEHKPEKQSDDEEVEKPQKIAALA